jgi:hypothetical protein
MCLAERQKIQGLWLTKLIHFVVFCGAYTAELTRRSCCCQDRAASTFGHIPAGLWTLVGVK